MYKKINFTPLIVGSLIFIYFIFILFLTSVFSFISNLCFPFLMLLGILIPIYALLSIENKIGKILILIGGIFILLWLISIFMIIGEIIKGENTSISILIHIFLLLHLFGFSFILYGMFHSLNIKYYKIYIIGILLSFSPFIVAIFSNLSYLTHLPEIFLSKISLIVGFFALLSGVFTFVVSIKYGGKENGEKKY